MTNHVKKNKSVQTTPSSTTKFASVSFTSNLPLLLHIFGNEKFAIFFKTEA